MKSHNPGIIKNGAKAPWFAAVSYPLAKANGNRYEIASQIFIIASIHYRQF